MVAAEPSSEAKSGTVNYCAREPQAAYRLHESKDEWQLESKTAAGTSVPVHHACRERLLDEWFEAAKSDIPHRSHRKLTPHKLRNFLQHSGGRWFRLRDFERFVQMDRKTAWDYLQLFLQTGLLCHNRKNSAAVRYCLAPNFLRVEADALRLAIGLCLSTYAEDLVEKVSDFLIATGGEPFPVQEWEQEFPASRNESLLDDLVACHIAVWQNLPTGSRFLRLHNRWRQQKNQPCLPKDRHDLMYPATTSDR